MDDIGIYIKAVTAAAIAAVSVRLGALGELLWLFITAMALDYITGVAAAACHKELGSAAGFKGIVRKAGKCAVIAVGLVTDGVASQAGAWIGYPIQDSGAVTAVITIWLILNELVSILENLDKTGVDLPPFLVPAVRLLKRHTEARAGNPGADKLSEVNADVQPGNNTPPDGEHADVNSTFDTND